MGKPETPKDVNIVIDGNSLEMINNLLKELAEKYPDGTARTPTVEELQRLFNLGFQVGAGNALFQSMGFDAAAGRKSMLTEPQKWALATSAIPKQASELELDVLGGGEATADYVEAIQEMLEEDWEVRDSSDAIDTIGWLKYTGHREEFDLMLRNVSGLDDEEFRYLVNGYAEEPGLQKQLRLVYSKSNSAGNRSIVGWDYCRLVYVAECCCVAGYLAEEEAWGEIMAAARVIQSTFSSWKEMSDNYLLGRKFWSGGSEPRITTAVKFLLSSPKSPWVRYPWDLPLDKSGL